MAKANAETVETLHAPRGATEPKRAPKGEGTTISIELKEYPELLAAIRTAASDDDRSSSVWLRRRILQLFESNSLF